MRKTRREGGMGAVEIAINSLLLICLVALGIDITLLLLAASLSDSACRDAARAAGSIVTTREDTYETAKRKAFAAASAQMLVHKTDGYFISQPELTMPVFFWPPGGQGATDLQTGQVGPEQLFTQSKKGTTAQYPFVECVTTVSVRLPVSVPFLSEHFNGDRAQKFSRAYFYPMVRVKVVNPNP
jgi:hypothetical protein